MLSAVRQDTGGQGSPDLSRRKGLRSGRGTRRGGDQVHLSISALGLMLGVAVLITVLSVMNGFQKELTTLTLSMASHATILERNGDLSDWRAIAEQVEKHPEVEAVAPYFRADGMLVNDKQLKGTLIRGILPEEESRVSEITEKMVNGHLSALKSGEFGIILGKDLSNSLQVLTGDKVTLVAPQANVTPAGILPRLKRFTVVGIFEIGMQEFDNNLALIHLADDNYSWFPCVSAMRWRWIKVFFFREKPGAVGNFYEFYKNFNF